jgi:formiminoglutamate deiminase
VTKLWFKTALLPEGWASSVLVEIEEGRIRTARAESPRRDGECAGEIAIPGLANLHSHAFQRGMAGLAERRGDRPDSFWTWRETMYRFALSMSPDDVESVATWLYVEMLEAGFTRVGEFHYLHHDIDGRPYGNIAEMAQRIAAAAAGSGIALTLLPVFYAHATFGGAPPLPEQRRFISDLDLFARLLEDSRATVRGLGGSVVGVAPHSLRAVTPKELVAVVALAGNNPIHIHAAEQVKEVEDSLAWSGKRPVAWLLGNAELERRWCLIHATHMDEAETSGLAASGATAGLCPVTEANLGDGIFNGAAFVKAGGRYGIGTDSNIRVGVADELRQLEYAQRLDGRARNVMAVAGGSTGRALFDAAVHGGAVALGSAPAGLMAGAAADIVTLKPDHPALVGRVEDAMLDAWIFAAGSDLVDSVWARGEQQVAGGRHLRREAIRRRFDATILRLSSQ